MQTLRTMHTHEDEPENEQSLCDALDFIDEQWESALIRLFHYKQSIARFYNKGVSSRKFEVGDLVLRKTFWILKDLANSKIPFHDFGLKS